MIFAKSILSIEGARGWLDLCAPLGADDFILQWDTSVPNEKIQLYVENGVVTLNGEVQWQCHRTAAEEAVLRLIGVKGVKNQILVRPRANAGNIRKIIEEALRRNVGIEPRGVRVGVVDGNKVVLEGSVRNLAERKAVEDAAWCALGVESVENRLTLSNEAPR